MGKNILFENCKELIFLFLKKGDKFNYGAQIKIAKKLLSQFPEMEFWRSYDPKSVFTSLSVFLTKSGQKELKREYDLWNFTKPKESKNLEEKSVIDIKVEQKEYKPTTIEEFIDSKL